MPLLQHLLRGGAASNRALNRLGFARCGAYPRSKKRSGEEEHRKIAAPQIRRIGCRIVGALAAVSSKKSSGLGLGMRNRLRGQAHLVAVTLVDFVLTSAHGVQ